jgi:hypothetical protein
MEQEVEPGWGPCTLSRGGDKRRRSSRPGFRVTNGVTYSLFDPKK